MNRLRIILFTGILLAIVGSAGAEPVVTVHLSYEDPVEADYISITNSTPDLHQSEGPMKFVLYSGNEEALYSQKSGLPYQTILTEGEGVKRSLAETQRVNLPYIEGSEKIHIFRNGSKVGEYDIPEEEISVETDQKNKNFIDELGAMISNNMLIFSIISILILIAVVLYLSIVPEE